MFLQIARVFLHTPTLQRVLLRLQGLVLIFFSAPPGEPNPRYNTGEASSELPCPAYSDCEVFHQRGWFMYQCPLF